MGCDLTLTSEFGATVEPEKSNQPLVAICFPPHTWLSGRRGWNTRQRRKPDGAGGVYEEEFQLPVRFDAMANGYTPMNAAFSAVLRRYVTGSAHTQRFPPVIINLTDGAYTEEVRPQSSESRCKWGPQTVMC